MSLIKLMIIMAYLFLGASCAEQDTAAGKYLRSHQAGAAQEADGSPSDTGAPGSEDPDQLADDEDDAAEDDDVASEEDPEAVALALRQEGKQIYEGLCMGCHGAIDASSLNARDNAGVEAAMGLQVHMGLVGNNTYPQGDDVSAIVAFLNEPI